MGTEKPITVSQLVSMWITGCLIFQSGEVAQLYGAFGGVTLAAAYFFGFLVLQRLLISLPLHDHYQHVNKQLVSLGGRILAYWLALMWLELLITQGMVAGLAMQSLLDMPIWAGITLFSSLGLAVVLISFSRLLQAKLYVFLKITLFFILSIFFPIYIYLQKGLETVYHNLLHYHPRVLYLEQPGMITFFLAAFFIMFCKLLVGSLEREEEMLLQPKKAIRKLGVMVFGMATAILAFSSMTIVSITEKIQPMHLNEQIIELLRQKASLTLYVVFTIVLLFITFSAFVQHLHTLAIFVSDQLLSGYGWRFHRYAVSAGLVVVAYAVAAREAVQAEMSIIDLFCLFGLINGPVGIFLAFVMRYKANVFLYQFIPLVGIAIGLAQWLMKKESGLPAAVVSGSVATALLLFIIFVVKYVLQKSKNSKKNTNETAKF